ncbi:MAG TPA: hypothetical protein VMF90_20780 [Rhizobiaceae bacterium]|nr:hypothetical protein [Rhizobiaceae bacterium]
MRASDVIRAGKTDESVGAWSDDKLKAKEFPLSKKRGQAFPLSRRYRWQIICFKACGRSYRVLVAYHTLLPEFITVLAEDVMKDCKVLARWEFHGSHGGWHVHANCGDTDGLTKGVVKPAGVQRIPAKGSYHRHTKLLNDGHVMDDGVAHVIACGLVRIAHHVGIFDQDAVPWS